MGKKDSVRMEILYVFSFQEKNKIIKYRTWIEYMKESTIIRLRR